jgi:hypothetical protein
MLRFLIVPGTKCAASIGPVGNPILVMPDDEEKLGRSGLAQVTLPAGNFPTPLRRAT